MSQQINLFNPIFLKQKKIFTALPMAEALGVIVLGALLMTWYASHNVGQLEQRAAHGKTLLAERERRLQEAHKQFAPRQKNPALTTDLVQAQAQLDALHRVEQFIQQGTLGNSTGYAEYFRAFARQNVSGLWLTGMTIAGAGTSIGLQGRAMQPTLIPQYIGRLTSERVLQGKTFASLEIGRPGMAVAPLPAAEGAAQPAAAMVAPPAPYVQFSLQSTGVQAK